MFVELHAHSAFSFLRGASQPETIMRRAAELGYEAVAICDENGLYGSARAHATALQYGLKSIVGASVKIGTAGSIPVLVRNRRGYQVLCKWLTNQHLNITEEVQYEVGDLVCLTGCHDSKIVNLLMKQRWKEAKTCVYHLIERFGREHVHVEIFRHYHRSGNYLEKMLIKLAEQLQLQIVAVNSPIYSSKQDRLLSDAFTCLRHHTTLDQAGNLLEKNSERYLKHPNAMRDLFADKPEWILASQRLANSLEFTLENLGYKFPHYHDGNRLLDTEEENQLLAIQSREGIWRRYQKKPKLFVAKVEKQLQHELSIIRKLGFSGYFLIVWDMVNWAQKQGILCQGRGSAANSVVCYTLGITNVDPVGGGLLFERFLSENRQSWPDVDVDFPSGDKRESVIQYMYDKYSPRGAAMTANVITYRKRSAFREMSKVLGFHEIIADRFSKTTVHQETLKPEVLMETIRRCDVESSHPHLKALSYLFSEVMGKPRHLGQHPGGMIISNQGLDQIVPLQPATMPGRTILQWDKNDCESLGIVKVDLLGLGMMAAMEDMIRLSRERGKPVDIALIPKDDKKVYELLCKADTVGTFQVESRAQMATLPIMQPRCFYDLVVEVALIRPGPIVGDLVHPYLNRRKGREEIDYIHPVFEDILERTLGVPLFQEQVLKMAMAIADFTGTDAEELRKAMSFQRSHKKMQTVTQKLRIAMESRDIDKKVQEKVIESIGSFALYGFPESHAISFALIAYASCWMKVHRTAEFYAGLLNNQPMGFYSPSSLIYDARQRGIRVKPVCVQYSTIDTRVIDDRHIRLGLKQLVGVSKMCLTRVIEQRSHTLFHSVMDFIERVKPNKKERRVMAEAGALNTLPEIEHRRSAMWHVEHHLDEFDLFHKLEQEKQQISPLKKMGKSERLNADYTTTGVTTGGHPMWIWRCEIDPKSSYYRAADMYEVPHGQTIYLSGMVICRQRPTTGKGHCFLSMEDETGISNLFIPKSTFENYRLIISTEAFLLVYGRVQINEGNSRSLYVLSVEPLPQPPQSVQIKSHDYC